MRSLPPLYLQLQQWCAAPAPPNGLVDRPTQLRHSRARQSAPNGFNFIKINPDLSQCNGNFVWCILKLEIQTRTSYAILFLCASKLHWNCVVARHYWKPLTLSKVSGSVVFTPTMRINSDPANFVNFYSVRATLCHNSHSVLLRSINPTIKCTYYVKLNTTIFTYGEFSCTHIQCIFRRHPKKILANVYSCFWLRSLTYVPQLEIQQSVSYFQIWTFMVHRGAFAANTALSHPPCCEASDWSR